MHKPHHLQAKILGCARLLVNKGAKVNAQDRHHMTALLYACQTGQADVAELLMSAKADVNTKDVRGWTVSHCVTYYAKHWRKDSALSIN